MKEYTFNRRLHIDDLDLTFQARAAMDADVVDEYAEAMADHVEFPPVDVRELGTPDRPRYVVTDGQHRVAAAKKIGQTEIIARVVPGTLTMALLDVLKANSTHGLRRTNADKRHTLEMAWMHRREIWPREDGADPSADVLAKACGVSRRTVERFLEGSTTDNVGGSEGSTTDNVGGSTTAAPKMPTRTPPAQPAQITQPMPTMPRRVFGVDGKVRAMPPKIPTRPTAAGFGSVAAAGHIVPVDRFGVEIPLAAGGAFTVEAEKVFTAILHAVSEARTAVKNGRANDAAFAAMRQETEFALNNAYSFVKSAMPFCVCRMCQGNGCMACHERGWQTEEEYNRNPVEFKS